MIGEEKKTPPPGQKTEYKHIGYIHWVQKIEKHIKEKKKKLNG